MKGLGFKYLFAFCKVVFGKDFDVPKLAKLFHSCEVIIAKLLHFEFNGVADIARVTKCLSQQWMNLHRYVFALEDAFTSLECSKLR